MHSLILNNDRSYNFIQLFSLHNLALINWLLKDLFHASVLLEDCLLAHSVSLNTACIGTCGVASLCHHLFDQVSPSRFSCSDASQLTIS